MKRFASLLIILILLLIFHQEVIAGAKNGLLLWYQILIPSLLPFILVTNALSETGAYQALIKRFSNKINTLVYEFIAIILGNLCGYPIGGKILSDFVENGYLNEKRGNQLLSVASQSSPMFLLGYVYSTILEKSIPLPVFLLSVYIPVLLLYCLKISTIPQKKRFFQPCLLPSPVELSDTFLHAVSIMVSIGIYVMIFSILLTIALPRCTYLFQKAIFAFLEITTGLKLLKEMTFPPYIQIPLIGALSSYGGLCSAFQIRSVLTYKNASIKKYLLDKSILSAGTFSILWFYVMTKL